MRSPLSTSHPAHFNTLEPVDRARLLRTTRKLGALLGATPLMLESTALSLPVSLLPIGKPTSHSSHSRTHSSPSLSASARKRHAIIAPFTCHSSTSLQSTSSTSSAASASTASLVSVSSQSSFEPECSSSSDSDSDAAPSSINASRKVKTHPRPRPLLLRLNVAPRYVVPGSPSPSPSSASSSSFASACPSPAPVLSPPMTAIAFAHPPDTAALLATPLPLVPPTPAPAARRRKMAKLTRTLGENVPAELVFRPTPSSTAAFSLAPKPVAQQGKAQAQGKGKTERTRKRRSSNFGFGAANGTVRKGDHWIGAWNRKDIRDVQHGLRALRAR